MSFERRSELWTYDIFPKVVTAGKKVCIHIRPFGGREFFEPGEEYTAVVRWLNGGKPEFFPTTAYMENVTAKADENGIDLELTLPSEGEYRLSFKNDDKELTFAVYAVEGDLVGVYPFIGDLHMHTN